MDDQRYQEFVEAVQSANIAGTDIRATCHTSAVFASEWDRVEEQLRTAEPGTDD
jgi:hypothetical protein